MQALVDDMNAKVAEIKLGKGGGTTTELGVDFFFILAKVERVNERGKIEKIVGHFFFFFIRSSSQFNNRFELLRLTMPFCLFPCTLT